MAMQDPLEEHPRQLLLDFWETYGELPPYEGQGHWLLACQAALPLVITPDLLSRLWANFSSTRQGPVDVPYEAVSDLLLSPLLRKVGGDRFEMDTPIRDALLMSLQAHEGLGTHRAHELARFLKAYADKHLQRPMDRRLRQLQRWTADAYLQPARLAQELTECLNAYEETRAQAEQLRVAQLVESLAVPLQDYRTLLHYTRGLKAQIYEQGKDDIQRHLSQLSPQPEQEVAGATLRISRSLQAYLPRTTAAPPPPDPWQQLRLGQVLEGEITQQLKDGFQMNLRLEAGKLSAFLPLPEIRWAYLRSPQESGLSVGDAFKLKVIRLERAQQQVEVSRKRLLASPWEHPKEVYFPWRLVSGTVVDIEKDEALRVEVAPGIIGRIHRSEVSGGKVTRLDEGTWLDKQLEAAVLSFQPEKEQMELSLRQASAGIPVPTMVRVQGGSFLMGSPEKEKDRDDDERLHEVSLSEYDIAQAPVTNAQFAAFLNAVAKGDIPKWEKDWILEDDDFKIKQHDGRYQAETGYELHPVIQVNWHAAVAYA